MEQFELRFIVCGSDLAATNGCAKILFEAPLPGKVTLRQDGKFLFGTVTIGYAGGGCAAGACACFRQAAPTVKSAAFPVTIDAVLNSG